MNLTPPPASATGTGSKTRKFVRLATVSLLLALAGLTLGCQSLPGPPVASYVDLERYQGRWYEIAHLPFSRQEGCYGTTATYTLDEDGEVAVTNRCRKGGFQAEEESAEGSAWVVEPSSNAKLKVQFFWPFRGDYWILAVEDDYRWALVGTPDREYLWLLSRTPTLPDEQLEAIVALAAERGYPVSQLIRTPQRQGG